MIKPSADTENNLVAATNTETKKKNLVFFADDQKKWHNAIDRTKDRHLPLLDKSLSNCEIVSVYNASELFLQLTRVLLSEPVDSIVVFLDLMFPTVKDGLETLNRLSRNVDERIRQIPVFVYSVSRDPSEIAAVYSRNGAGFYNKVKHPDTFWSALSSIDSASGYHLSKPKDDTDVTSQKPSNDITQSELIL